MTRPPDDRARLAKAYDRAGRVVTVAVGMVAPAVAGYFLDRHWNVKVVFTALGAAIGLAFGIWQLVGMNKSGKNKSEDG